MSDGQLPLDKQAALEKVIAQATSRWRVAIVPAEHNYNDPTAYTEYVYDSDEKFSIPALMAAQDRFVAEHPDLETTLYHCSYRIWPVHR